jgi:hypothetical protein
VRAAAIQVALAALRKVAASYATVGAFKHSAQECREAIRILTPKRRAPQKKA